MVFTRSSQQNTPSLPDQRPDANPDATETRGPSKSPAKEAPIHWPPRQIPAISHFVRARGEAFHSSTPVEDVPDSEPAAEAHDSSDLLTTPSTFLEIENGKFVNRFKPPSPPTFHQSPDLGAESPAGIRKDEEPKPEAEAKVKADLRPVNPLLSPLQAEADAETGVSDTPANPEMNSSPSPHLPTYRSTGSLRSLISGARYTLKVDEEKLEEMMKPESGDVLHAHQEMNGLLSQYEQAKREYEWKKAQHEVFTAQRIEIQNRRRQLNEAERELDGLCH